MPTLAHVTKWFAVEDAKISKLLTDPAGGTATYGTAVDVPGIKTVGLTIGVGTKSLRGDNKLLDQDTNIVSLGVQFSRAKMSLDELGVILGGTVSDSGSTPNQIAKYRHLGATKPNYFKFEASTTHVDVGLGDGHIIVYKAILAGNFDLGFAEEDYKTFTATCQSVPRTADDFWFDVPLNETAVVIA